MRTDDTQGRSAVMFRLTRPVTAVTILALVSLSACGGGGDEVAVETDDAVVVEEVSTDAGAADLGPVVAAIEATGYDCTPESFVMTSAIRETCLTTTSVSLSAYAWSDAATMAAEADSELFCTMDSGLGELASVRGDVWAISAVSLSGSNTPETKAAIDEVLTGLATSLGGTVVSTPCA